MGSKSFSDIVLVDIFLHLWFAKIVSVTKLNFRRQARYYRYPFLYITYICLYYVYGFICSSSTVIEENRFNIPKNLDLIFYCTKRLDSNLQNL